MSRITDLAKWYQEYKNKEKGEGKSPIVYTDVRDKFKASVIKRAYEEGTLQGAIDSFVGRINTYH